MGPDERVESSQTSRGLGTVVYSSNLSRSTLTNVGPLPVCDSESRRRILRLTICKRSCGDLGSFESVPVVLVGASWTVFP